jgi:hypothetical protein
MRGFGIYDTGIAVASAIVHPVCSMLDPAANVEAALTRLFSGNLCGLPLAPCTLPPSTPVVRCLR